jgi:hypothetical protein
MASASAALDVAAKLLGGGALTPVGRLRSLSKMGPALDEIQPHSAAS